VKINSIITKIKKFSSVYFVFENTIYTGATLIHPKKYIPLQLYIVRCKKMQRLTIQCVVDDSISSEPPKVAFSHPLSGIG
jgi:hypothetical protein